MGSVQVLDTKVIIPRVALYGRKPRTPGEALRQARALLAEEGQWAQGHFFEDGDPEDAYEASSCGSWSACSMGAIGLVTGEMPVKVEKTGIKKNEWELQRDWRSAVAHKETEQSFAAYKKEHKDEVSSEDYRWSVSDEFSKHDTPLSAKAAQYLALALLDPEVDPDRREDVLWDGNDAIEVVIDTNDSGFMTRTKILQAFDKAAELARKPLPKQ